ncbi:helix-turn-helix transcriptional regulator [Nocardioides ferulae]|uniref:helix-turn-helix transcriptional regulator n=1 Tax=Nocardioides ferulae TaxID=2340821 RepID=UPI001F0CBC1C|nr:helix-turn-helix domain-containing protein [Nocardioides ferulae]
MVNTALGPRPARSASGRAMSPSRAALLETLQAQPDPTSLQALVTMTGLHANTVREHLDALIRRGLVTREQAPPSGRGRPGWLYRATHRGGEPERPEYAGLAATLAAVVTRTSPDPARDARAAGADWGRRLAQDAGAPDAPGPEAARRQVGRIFEQMGFEPESEDDGDATTMRLTRCPLLEAAHQNREVVCSVHLGIAEGAMEVYGEDGSGSELVPFAEPGACLLHLRPAPR